MWCEKATVAILNFAIAVLAAASHVPDSHFFSRQTGNTIRLKIFQVERGAANTGKDHFKIKCVQYLTLLY